MQPVFYLDLDRTLFRTDMAAEIFAMVERLYPENYQAREGYTKRAEHYVYPQRATGDDSSYYHDVSRWLRDVGIDEHEAFDRLASTSLADGHLEYPGVARLVRALLAYGEVKLLTYGEDSYQRFKARLCPSLKAIEVITTVDPKVDYLNTYAKDGDWIIDDKQIVGLKSGVHAVQVVQEREVQGVLGSLSQVEAYITATL